MNEKRLIEEIRTVTRRMREPIPTLRETKTVIAWYERISAFADEIDEILDGFVDVALFELERPFDEDELEDLLVGLSELAFDPGDPQPRLIELLAGVKEGTISLPATTPERAEIVEADRIRRIAERTDELLADPRFLVPDGVPRRAYAVDQATAEIIACSKCGGEDRTFRGDARGGVYTASAHCETCGHTEDF